MKRIFLLLIMAASICACAQSNDLLSTAKRSLESGKSVSSILTDPRYDSLHPKTEFRELIKSNAKAEVVTLANEKEPGEKIIVKGTIYNSQHQPLANALVYVYHTDTRGWYGSDRVHFQMNEGDRRHARLFAYFKTDAKGNFEFHTTQPHGYPESTLPAHIHFEVFDKDRMLLITELLFDDDERLQGDIRSRAIKEGFVITKPSKADGKKIYQYIITTTL